MMDKKTEKRDWKEIESISFYIRQDRWLVSFQEILMFLLTIVYSALAAWLYEKTLIEVAGTAILAGTGFGCVLFSIEQSLEEESFFYDNGDHLWRFVAVYLFSFGGSVLFPMLPAGGWPYLVIFVGLMFFSNRIIGFTSGCTLLLISVLIRGDGIVVFITYLIGALAGILVFSYVYDSFKIWLALVISLLIQGVCLAVQEILFSPVALSVRSFAVPACNLLVSLVLLLLLLKFFSNSRIYRDRELYMELNDPDYPLLAELKEFSREEYYHAIHTAYLCDRVAKKLGYDDAVTKACGYYHRIGVIRGENSWENVQAILEEHAFPQGARNILQEYLDEGGRIFEKEAVVLLFCDTVISSISYLFSKDTEAVLEYPKIINMVLKKQIESGRINHSRVSFGEIQSIRRILLEEQLYYEFLR